MLVIHPDKCIDCGVCEPECPIDAIKPEIGEPARVDVQVLGRAIGAGHVQDLAESDRD